jgi:hypothetical protein
MALVSYPAQPPKEIVSKLNAAAVEALVDPAVRSRLIDLGFEIFLREQQRSAVRWRT